MSWCSHDWNLTRDAAGGRCIGIQVLSVVLRVGNSYNCGADKFMQRDGAENHDEKCFPPWPPHRGQYCRQDEKGGMRKYRRWSGSNHGKCNKVPGQWTNPPRPCRLSELPGHPGHWTNFSPGNWSNFARGPHRCCEGRGAGQNGQYCKRAEGQKASQENKRP